MELLLRSMFNTQLLITVHNSSNTSTTFTGSRTQLTNYTAGKYTSYLFAFQHSTVDHSSSITHVQLYKFSHTTVQVHYKTLPYIANSVSIATSPSTLLCYYGNATNSLSPNSKCYVTMETPSRTQYVTILYTFSKKIIFFSIC
jgi:hypothetical protein